MSKTVIIIVSELAAQIANQEASKLRYSLITQDASVALETLPDESVDLIITSPPYNIRKSYERTRKLTLDEYVAWQADVIALASAKIKESGSVCWQTGNFVADGEVHPLDFHVYEAFKFHGFKLRNRIIWRFNFGLNSVKRFSGRYETLLWFTKSNKYTFNLDPVRVPQLYPGKRHSKTKGDRAGMPSGNPLGKNPSDYWEFRAETYFLENPVWEIPNVKANHPEKTIHPCQFPVELAERCVLALTEAGDTVLDPFVGTGTAIIAALKHSRVGIGIDREPSFLEIAERELVNS